MKHREGPQIWSLILFGIVCFFMTERLFSYIVYHVCVVITTPIWYKQLHLRLNYFSLSTFTAKSEWHRTELSNNKEKNSIRMDGNYE